MPLPFSLPWNLPAQVHHYQQLTGPPGPQVPDTQRLTIEESCIKRFDMAIKTDYIYIVMNTTHPSVLILDAKFRDQDTGTNLHTQDRSNVLNAQVRHVLIGAICHVLLFGTNLHTQES